MTDNNDSRGVLDLVPRPDPTKLTTDQLRQEIKSLREILETRMDGTDDLYKLLKEKVNDVQVNIDISIRHLNELVSSNIITLQNVTSERFARIETQFTERDTRTDQRAGDTKLAVDAAFAAAKEATAKIEAGFTKQIDSMSETVDTKTTNLDGRISDIKERLTTIESKPKSDMIYGAAVGAVGMILAAISIVALMIKWVAH